MGQSALVTLSFVASSLLVLVTLLAAEPTRALAPAQLVCRANDVLTVAPGVSAQSAFPDGLHVEVHSGCALTIRDVSARSIRLTPGTSAAGASISINRVAFSLPAVYLAGESAPSALIRFESAAGSSSWIGLTSVLVSDATVGAATTWDPPASARAAATLTLVEFAGGGAVSASGHITVRDCTLVVARSDIAVAVLAVRNATRIADTPLVAVRGCRIALTGLPQMGVAAVPEAPSYAAALVTLEQASEVNATSLLITGSSVTVDAAPSAVGRVDTSAAVSALRIESDASLSAITAEIRGVTFTLAAPATSVVVGTTTAPTGQGLTTWPRVVVLSLGAATSSTVATAAAFAITRLSNLTVDNVSVVLAAPSTLAVLPPPGSAYGCTVLQLCRRAFAASLTTAVVVSAVSVRFATSGAAGLGHAAVDPLLTVIDPCGDATAQIAAGMRLRLLNTSWGCGTPEVRARVALGPFAATASLTDGCPPPQPAGAGAAAETDMEKAAGAFFSTAIVSAAAMSSVAFGLSRSQVVGDFVAMSSRGACGGGNATERPVFSDSPLGLDMGPEWCNHFAGTCVGNAMLTAGALAVSFLFGVLGCCARRKPVTLNRVLNYGCTGIVWSNAIGLFLTPTISHAALCSMREGGSVAARVVMGAAALLLFFGVPLWLYLVLIRSGVCRSGRLVADSHATPSLCRRVCGGFWRYWFGAREWEYVGAAAIVAAPNAADDAAVAELTFGAVAPAPLTQLPLLSVPVRADDTPTATPLADQQQQSPPPPAATAVDGEAASAPDDSEQRQRFLALLPLISDYDTAPHWFFYEALAQALLALPVVLSDVLQRSYGGRQGCLAFGVPLALVLSLYWVGLAARRPIVRRVILLATFAVAGLQAFMTGLALYAVLLDGAKVDWASSIDRALLLSQVVLSLVGLVIAVSDAVFAGGLRRLRNCLCPRKGDQDGRSGSGGVDADDGGNNDAAGDDESTACKAKSAGASSSGAVNRIPDVVHDDMLLAEMTRIARVRDGTARDDTDDASATLLLGSDRAPSPNNERTDASYSPADRASGVSLADQSML